MTRHAARGGLRIVHAAQAAEARRSIDDVAGFYRGAPAPARPTRARSMRIVNALHRLVAPLGVAVLVTAIVFVAWLFGVFVLA